MTSNRKNHDELLLAELTESDIAMLEMAAQQGVQYLDYIPEDDEADEE